MAKGQGVVYIKLMVIERTGMEKIKVNVNGGKYDND